VQADAAVTGTLARMEVWVDGVKKYSETTSKSLSTSLTLATGTHRFNIYAVNTAGTKWEATVNATVSSSTKTTPTITWANPAPITSGTPLSSTQLDATASVSGTFVYSPASGTVLASGTQTLSTTFTPTDTTNYNTATTSVTILVQGSSSGLSSLNHIVILLQENRSLDSYLGALREYWVENGYPDQSFDGLPQFNPTTGTSPLVGPAPTNPGCKPNVSSCEFDTSVPVTSFHLKTMCNENTSPSWNEAHNDWDPTDNVGNSPAKNDGFVFTAAYDARALGYYDKAGMRAMGYYDGSDLNYLYFMASNFGTSDRFFHPAMDRTNINREYLIGATSGGYAYPNGTNSKDTAQLKTTTIFQKLQAAGISWKIYVNPTGTGCAAPYTASCLMNNSYLHNFTYAQTVVSSLPNNIVPITQYFTDIANGTLPAVALIEPASDAGLDEHGSDTDKAGTNVQKGENYVASLVNALMDSPEWSSSAFIWSYDESGGMYDHVSPQKMPSPDGIKPVDLMTGDICTKSTGPTCDFVYTGYRIPLVVVSPFAKKHYVSHTVADYTAILKLIETRFNITPINKRDAAQMDMTEFFDFTNPPWVTPPTPPVQVTNGECYLNKLP
jgi:phospholipase C